MLEVRERLKNLGFRINTKAGLSIGIEDLIIPNEKRWTTPAAHESEKEPNLRSAGSEDYNGDGSKDIDSIHGRR